MLAVLSANHVYILWHCEDYYVGPSRLFDLFRAILCALRMVEVDSTPRVIHVRRFGWDHYEPQVQAARDAGYLVVDVFIGSPETMAMKLPREREVQTLITECSFI